MVKLLVEKVANIESKDRDGWTPLIHGIFFNYFFNLNYLLFLFIDSHGGHSSSFGSILAPFTSTSLTFSITPSRETINTSDFKNKI